MASTKRCMVFLTVLGAILLICGSAGAEKIEPPWTSWHPGGINFTVPGIDNVPDLWGEIVKPDLVIFFAGNQFMAVPDLLDAFRKKYPHYQKIYVETLPPGILARQMAEGGLVIGNLKITIAPDIFTAGEHGIKAVEKKHPGIFEKTVPYARNRLAIMVRKGNPKKITSLKDLGKKDIRVSMPNPHWEGVARQIIAAYEKAGGQKTSG
jgi:molybdate transport system substrate-binding protein